MCQKIVTRENLRKFNLKKFLLGISSRYDDLFEIYSNCHRHCSIPSSDELFTRRNKQSGKCRVQPAEGKRILMIAEICDPEILKFSLYEQQIFHQSFKKSFAVHQIFFEKKRKSTKNLAHNFLCNVDCGNYFSKCIRSWMKVKIFGGLVNYFFFMVRLLNCREIKT